MEKLKLDKMTSEYARDIQLFEKIDEIIDKLNDLEQIVYDFTGHIKP